MVGSEGLMVWEEETGLFFSFFFSLCMVKIGFTMKKNEENGEGLILAVWDSSLIIGKLIIFFLSIVLPTW